MANDKEKLFNSDKEKNNYHADLEFEMRYWKDEIYSDDSNFGPEKYVEKKHTWPPPCPKNHTQSGWNLFIKEYERVILKKESNENK